YQYNRAGNIAAIVDPTGEQETYLYDGENRLIQKTDRNGVTVEFGYNLYGAPLFRKEKNGTLGDFYEYTPEGLVQCAISAGMRYNYTYDVMGRMVEKSASGRALLALTYDQNGNKVRQTDVTGKVTEYTYSPMDLLTTVCDDGGELAAYDYNPDGTVKALVHGPIRQDYTYDLDKNLVGLKVQSAGELLADNLYQYDGNGNRTRKQQLGGDTYYHYDPLNQLQRVEYPGYIEELFYDKAGNRTRRIAQGVEELYRYDPRNRLTFLTKGGVTTSFQYDNAGNLLADDKAQYSYDAFNRTIRAELFDGNVQVNRYDAEGLRYEMEENGNLVQFIFNLDREAVTERDASGITRLIRGTELIVRNTDTVRTYYHYASDEMGSTTHIVDDEGQVQNRYEYDAWGNLTTQEEVIPNRFKYTGQQLDPITQQYYLRARFYNPVIARFTQEDTYRGDGLNLYAYCVNNPIYYVDPSGNNPDCVNKDAQAEANKHRKRDKDAEGNKIPNADDYRAAYKIWARTKVDVDKLKSKLENGKITREEFKRLDRYNRLLDKNSRQYTNFDGTLNIRQPSNPQYHVAPYSELKKNQNIVGQAHHINQNAAYGSVIPQQDGVSVKLLGNIFKDPDAQHTIVHRELEKFWDQYRGSKTKPTNMQYTYAVYKALVAADIDSKDAMEITRASIQQRVHYGLVGGETVPKVPNKIRNIAGGNQ
ncbi:MAG: RHS repeat domain-containing protein, partial [Butyricicoccus sp.]